MDSKNATYLIARFVAALTLLIGMLGVAPVRSVRANTLTVTNTNDSGPGSLRQAIFDAGSGDTITFSLSLAGQTITLSSQLTIDDNLIIDGSGLNPQVILSGGSTTRIMELTINAQVSISNLLFTQGASTEGGAIHASANSQLTLNNTTFHQNQASVACGAILIEGNSVGTIINTTFSQNQANGSGGAICINQNGSYTIANSKFLENSAGGSGGAIAGVNLTLLNSTLSRNIAGANGGAIYGVVLSIKNTTIDHNQANGSGGAMALVGNSYSLISNTTVFGNAAGYGGGGFSLGGNAVVDIYNSTFAQNSAVNGHEMMLTGVNTIALTNTIFLCAEMSNACYVWSGSSSVITPHSILAIGSLADYGLAELADNGGPTQTMALLPGSPLIDAGEDVTCANSFVNNLDQRGVTRPQGGHCDIGAFEYKTPVATFSDVDTDYWAWDFIERLYAAGITSGCGVSPPAYCPEGTVTRAQMAVFLERGIHGSSYTPPAVGASTGFGDVPINHWAAAWIKQFAADGITAGCGGGNYCPEASVTRAQMAVFLLKAKYGAVYTPPSVSTGTGFGDVATNYWSAAWIKQLAAEGITGGCGGGNYCPESPVTRAQMAVFLVKTFNLP